MRKKHKLFCTFPLLFTCDCYIIILKWSKVPRNGLKGRKKAMLMGKYPHSIDSKNRLIIPSKLKEQLGSTITIIKDAERCLCVYSAEEWTSYTAKINELPKSKAREIVRFLYANAVEVQPDGQGRVVLPQDMIEYAGITKNVVTVGCGKYVEIWAEEKWNEMKLSDEPEDFAATLELLGL